MRIPRINLTFVDVYSAMDAVPLPNIVTNGLVNLTAKGVLFTAALLNRPIDISKSAFLTHIYKKSTAKCIVLSVPVLGFISVALYDRFKSKGKDEVTDEPKKEPVAELQKESVAEPKEQVVNESKPKEDSKTTKPEGKKTRETKGKEREIQAKGKEKEDTKLTVAVQSESSNKIRNISNEIHEMFAQDWVVGEHIVNIQAIWKSIFGKAKFIDFQAVDKTKGLYKFNLEKALYGQSPKLPVAVNIPKEMTASFTSEGEKKILTFENKLPYMKIGFLKQIEIEGDYVTVTTWIGASERFSKVAKGTDDMATLLDILESIDWKEVI